MKMLGTKNRFFMVAALLLAAVLFSLSPAMADEFLPGDSADYAVLFDGSSGAVFSFNSGTLTGDVGIGGTGDTNFSGGSSSVITGNLNFSAPFTTQKGGTGADVEGTVNYSVPNVASDITALNSLSSTLGAESGTATTISSGGAINANSGVLDSSGNRVFTVTSISFPNGTFTITGTSSQYVVLNVSSSDATNGLNGSIALSGGITPDHVLINYYEGGTMTINTNGATTTGVFLDPDGMFTINHSVVDGWVFGGDAENSSIVSGGYVTVPTIPAVPLPPTALLFGTGILGLGMLGWRRKKY